MRRALLNLCAGFTLLSKAVLSKPELDGILEQLMMQEADYPITSFIQTFTQKT